MGRIYPPSYLSSYGVGGAFAASTRNAEEKANEISEEKGKANNNFGLSGEHALEVFAPRRFQSCHTFPRIRGSEAHLGTSEAQHLGGPGNRA